MRGSGALALSAGEVLLPVQSCVALLGSRLKAAALAGILRLCGQAMQRNEWQVRKAAADTLAALVQTLLADGGPAAAPGVAAHAQQGQQQGLAALQNLAPEMAAAVGHIRYDRIPQVRQAVAALLLQLQRLPGLQQEQAQAQRRTVQQSLGARSGSPRRPAAGSSPASWPRSSG